jgi:hypothetical protein
MMNRLCAAAAALVLGACAHASPPALPGGEPYVRGIVEAFTHSATASSLRVRAGEGCGLAARVDARTRYLRREAGSAPREIPRPALEAGDSVEVYVEGPMTRSCPPQAYAPVVIVVARP